MNGVMWFDQDPKKTLVQKVVDAATCYRDKTGGQVPDVCFVHPSALICNEIRMVGRVSVKPARFILPNHFWIGVEDKRHG